MGGFPVRAAVVATLAYPLPERAVKAARPCVDPVRRRPAEVVAHGRAGVFDPEVARMRP